MRDIETDAGEFDALVIAGSPDTVQAKVLVDGGVRSGLDVARMLALGAEKAAAAGAEGGRIHEFGDGGAPHARVAVLPRERHQRRLPMRSRPSSEASRGASSINPDTPSESR